MLEQIKQTSERYRMLQSGDRLLVAVSGGIDSVVLLHALSALQREYKLALGVAHFDHAIRPDSSQDAEFVRELARSLKLRCYTERADVPRYAQMKRLSLEVAARQLRYRFLEKTAQAHKFKKIALGHNLNDQAETLLMRLLRGTGLEGLAGIPPVRSAGKLTYVRPLIECSRKHIEGFAREHNLTWREDPSNRDTKILRNRIRHELLPILQRDYNPNLLETLGRTARLLAAASDYLQSIAESELINLHSDLGRSAIALDLKRFLKRPEFLRALILRAAIGRVQNLQGIEMAHLEAALNWLERGGAGELQLPGGLRLLRRHQRLIVTVQPAAKPAQYEYALSVPGETVIAEIGWRFQIDLTPWPPSRRGKGELSRTGERLGERLARAIIDAAKIQGSLIVRNRRPGDRITLQNGTKKLQDLFIDKKIPREERDRLPLICDAHRVIWIVGWCMNEEYRATPKARSLYILAERLEGAL